MASGDFGGGTRQGVLERARPGDHRAATRDGAGHAFGGIAFGGLAVGVVGIAGVAFGAMALGGLAMGGIALGGLAVGVIALGGLAIGTMAFGGIAIGEHVVSAAQQDPVALEFFRERLPWLRR